MEEEALRKAQLAEEERIRKLRAMEAKKKLEEEQAKEQQIQEIHRLYQAYDNVLSDSIPPEQSDCSIHNFGCIARRNEKLYRDEMFMRSLVSEDLQIKEQAAIDAYFADQSEVNERNVLSLVWAKLRSRDDNR